MLREAARHGYNQKGLLEVSYSLKSALRFFNSFLNLQAIPKHLKDLSRLEAWK
jgi:hypothetical protein